MSPRRSGRRRSRGPLLGLFLLAIGGVGIWGLAHWGDRGGLPFLPRTLESPVWEEEEALRTRPPIPAPGQRVRVQVLNAGGVRGVAGAAREELRDAGFDVVDYGNAASFDRETSVVILRAGPVEDARRVARTLGIASLEVALDTLLLAEVTVLLGSTWRTRAEREVEEAGTAETPGPGRGRP